MNVSETVAFIMEKADWPDDMKAAQQKALLEAPAYALNILGHLLEDILDVEINEQYGVVHCNGIDSVFPYASCPRNVFRVVVHEICGAQDSLHEESKIQSLAEEVTFGVYSHRTYAGEGLLPRILSSADFNLSMEKASYDAVESTYKLYVYRHAKELVRAEIDRRASAKVEEPVEVAHEEPSKNNTTTPPLPR